MEIIFTCLPFNELTLQQLYDIMVLRQEVFVVEQDCPYLDADGNDQHALHLMGCSADGELLLYARLLPKGISYEKYNAIGRVVTSSKARGQGHGRPLMQKAIKETIRHFGEGTIKLSAQAHLEKYYGSVGFEAVGEGYLEDGIPHIGMVRKGA